MAKPHKIILVIIGGVAYEACKKVTDYLEGKSEVVK